jgi:hypothetical protein
MGGLFTVPPYRLTRQDRGGSRRMNNRFEEIILLWYHLTPKLSHSGCIVTDGHRASIIVKPQDVQRGGPESQNLIFSFLSLVRERTAAFQVCSCSRSGRAVCANQTFRTFVQSLATAQSRNPCCAVFVPNFHRPPATEAKAGTRRRQESILVRAQATTNRKSKDPKRFLSSRPMKCLPAPGPSTTSTATKLIASQAAADPFPSSLGAEMAVSCGS